MVLSVELEFPLHFPFRIDTLTLARSETLIWAEQSSLVLSAAGRPVFLRWLNRLPRSVQLALVMQDAQHGLRNWEGLWELALTSFTSKVLLLRGMPDREWAQWRELYPQLLKSLSELPESRELLVCFQEDRADLFEARLPG